MRPHEQRFRHSEVMSNIYGVWNGIGPSEDQCKRETALKRALRINTAAWLGTSLLQDFANRKICCLKLGNLSTQVKMWNLSIEYTILDLLLWMQHVTLKSKKKKKKRLTTNLQKEVIFIWKKFSTKQWRFLPEKKRTKWASVFFFYVNDTWSCSS